MRFASSSLQCLAAAASDFTMSSSRTSYRGQTPWRRGFSDLPNNRRDSFVSGDSHLGSVRDANYGFRQRAGVGVGVGAGGFRNPARFQQHPQAFRPPHFCPPRIKPPDFRNWEYAVLQPPSHCERFIVLSYNILADYLAINHRHELYFHIPWHMLDWEWRKRRIVFELGLWSSDIMCLQEVDRYHDLEEELKLRGYIGIWKMRSGIPIDGCAIFWRTTRFKLLHEECIEFNKLGLRDNIAQICVLESKNQNPKDNGSTTLSTSSSGANQVVICNIHVLYNPKRGEIKLGQVRTLLNRAEAVSKLWNDAPVILCGDFNCTPKSPLYNFISEQKLNFSGLARDQISGQSSAEIYRAKPYSSNLRLGLDRAQTPPPDYSIGASMLVDEKELSVKQSNLISDLHQNKAHSNVGNASYLTNTLAQPQSFSTGVVDMSHKSCSETQCENEKNTISDAVREKTLQELVGGFGDDEFGSSNNNVPVEKLNESPSCCQDRATSFTNDGVEVSIPKSLENFSTSELIANEGKAKPSTSYQSTHEVQISDASSYEDQFPVDLSLKKYLGEDGSFGQDHRMTTPSPEISGSEDVIPFDDADCESAEANLPSEKCTSTIPHNTQSPPSSAQVQDDSLQSNDSHLVDLEKNVYDPYLWTPMEIETASGNAECTLLEHSLKLRSTYAEVEDYSGTRDSSREPQVTSYNRRFMGTVDYIWCSEGLQTVKVLDTIPKHALQWTPGFPTRKWGSDHIALATQLAFTKDSDRS